MLSFDRLLQRSVYHYRDRIALSGASAELTYGQLEQTVDRLAAQLIRDGSLPGERVAIIAPNVIASVVSMLAAWRAGAVVVPLSARWREYEIRRTLIDADVSAIISVPSSPGYSFVDLLPRIMSDLPFVRRYYVVAHETGKVLHSAMYSIGDRATTLGVEVGLILYTSGSTGTPKGALIRTDAEVQGAHALNEALDVNPLDASIFVIPLSHAFGLQCFLGALAAGSQSILVESTFSLEPTLEPARRNRATIVHGSPMLFAAMLKSLEALPPTLQRGFVAGAPCAPAVFEGLERAGLSILNLYGMTELGAATCERADDALHLSLHTAGRPLPGIELRIREGEEGAIEVCGPRVTPGYFQQPQANAEAFDDGWFRTGDLGFLDDQGNLTISGRAKDLVKVGGFNVFPAEVEGFLLTHPDVLEATVIGVDHALAGEALYAFVRPRPDSGLTSATLLQFARANIAGYKVPYRTAILPQLPHLSSGKADRAALRRLIESDQAG